MTFPIMHSDRSHGTAGQAGGLPFKKRLSSGLLLSVPLILYTENCLQIHNFIDRSNRSGAAICPRFLSTCSEMLQETIYFLFNQGRTRKPKSAVGIY